MTINKNIKYMNFNEESDFIYDDFFVLEIKTSINEDKTKLRNFFDFKDLVFQNIREVLRHLNFLNKFK